MSNIHDLLAELQKNYLASLPEKIANIDSLWRGGEKDKLKTEYHKLKGTGRTYGLPEVSKLGEVLEKLCERGDAGVLATAVPLSLELLAKIKETRQSGKECEIEKEEGFSQVVGLLK